MFFLIIIPLITGDGCAVPALTLLGWIIFRTMCCFPTVLWNQKTDSVFVCVIDQLGVKALTVEDLLQAQKEISAHNRQLKEQTKQLERDMSLLRDHSLLLVRLQCYIMFLYHAIIIIECGSDVTIHGAMKRSHN